MPIPIAELEIAEEPLTSAPVEPDSPSPEKPEPQEKPVEISVTNAKNIKLKMHLNNDWRVRLPADVTLEQAQDPVQLGKSLVLGSKSFTVLDNVLAVADDASWAIEALVVGCGLGWVQVAVLRVFELPDQRPEAESRIPAGYEIKRDAHTNKYGAFRISDGTPIIPSMCRSHEECLTELMAHAVFRSN